MNSIQYELKTKIGPLFLVASEGALQGVHFNKQPVPLIKQLSSTNSFARTMKKAVRQLEEYFSGQRQTFSLEYQLLGTPFQCHVWQELAKIPYGQTASYKQIAQRIKNPKAFRAVGTANGNNPMCIIIPCHRVIAADGSIGGYSGSITTKQKLLKFEGLMVRPRKV